MAAAAAPVELEVVRDDERGRYELRAPDGEVLGSADFSELRDGRVLLPHTVVPPRHGGRGHGTAVVRGALDDLRARGVTEVLPTCWFVAAFLDRHPEYADLVG